MHIAPEFCDLNTELQVLVHTILLGQKSFERRWKCCDTDSKITRHVGKPAFPGTFALIGNKKSTQHTENTDEDNMHRTIEIMADGYLPCILARTK